MDIYVVRLLGEMVFVLAADSAPDAIAEARDRAEQSPGYFIVMETEAEPETILHGGTDGSRYRPLSVPHDPSRTA